MPSSDKQEKVPLSRTHPQMEHIPSAGHQQHGIRHPASDRASVTFCYIDEFHDLLSKAGFVTHQRSMTATYIMFKVNLKMAGHVTNMPKHQPHL